MHGTRFLPFTRKQRKRKSRNKHKKTLPIFSFHIWKSARFFLCHWCNYLVRDVENVAKSLPVPKQICLETA